MHFDLVKDYKKVYVKMDVEHDEWPVILSMKSEELNRITMLDMEIHWCSTRSHQMRINLALQKLNKHFVTIGRLPDEVNFRRYCIMSVSYLNRNMIPEDVFSRK